MEAEITRAEHEEFRRRIEDERSRLNKRVEALEESVDRLGTLNVSIEKLASNMENMLKEQVRQGKSIEALESRDGERWRTVINYVLTAIVGIVIGFIFKQFGM